MLLDGNLQFVPLGSPLAITTGSIASPNTIDLLGVGVGVAPPSIIGTENATFGTDQGLGDGNRLIQVNLGTAFTTSDAATLQIALQAAPDTGVAGGYQPGTWTTLGETGVLAVASLTAGLVTFRFPILPAVPPNQQPRFLQLLFIVGSGLTFTAGTVAWAGIVNGRDDQGQLYAQRNYTI